MLISASDQESPKSVFLYLQFLRVDAKRRRAFGLRFVPTAPSRPFDFSPHSFVSVVMRATLASWELAPTHPRSAAWRFLNTAKPTRLAWQASASSRAVGRAGVPLGWLLWVEEYVSSPPLNMCCPCIT